MLRSSKYIKIRTLDIYIYIYKLVHPISKVDRDYECKK